MYHVFGHTSPDTDAFMSSLAFCHYLNIQQLPAIAYRLGEPNLETAYILSECQRRYPETIKPKLLPYLNPCDPFTILHRVDDVALTDHNEPAQSIDHLCDFNICYVIDHHKLGLSTPTPAYVRIHPVGCTCTILYEMFEQKSLEIPAYLAFLMLSAIISDTLNLTSPTTTHDDVMAVEKLCKLCHMTQTNKDDFADKMFAAKSDVSKLTARQILLMDYKEYTLGGDRWGIAGIETVSPKIVLDRQDELTQEAMLIQQEKGLNHLMIAIVDIKENMGYATAHDPAQNKILQQAFNTSHDDQVFLLPSVVSRKKQIIPALERYYHDLAGNA